MKDKYTLLPLFRKGLEVNDQLSQEERQRRIDKRTEILATILAAYPTTPRAQLASELGLNVSYITSVVRHYGVRKNKRVLVQKIVDGKRAATYPNLNAAAKAEGVRWHYLKDRIDADKPVNGATFKFSEQ